MRVPRLPDSMLPAGASDADPYFDMPSGSIDSERRTLKMTNKTNYTSIGIKPDERKEWIFTFGYSHTHPVTGESLGRSFVRIEGTLEGSREIMIQHFGDKWAMQYPGICEAGVHKYDLREIPLPTMEVA